MSLVKPFQKIVQTISGIHRIRKKFPASNISLVLDLTRILNFTKILSFAASLAFFFSICSFPFEQAAVYSYVYMYIYDFIRPFGAQKK